MRFIGGGGEAAHVDGEQTPPAPCADLSDVPGVNQAGERPEPLAQQFVNCSDHMCGAGPAPPKWKPCYVLSPRTTA